MKIILITLLLTKFCFVSAFETQDNSQLNKFNTAFQRYQDSLDKGDRLRTIQLASDLYELGLNTLPENDDQLGFAAQVYANAMNWRYSQKESIPFLRKAISIYEMQPRPPITSLINAKISLAKVIGDTERKWRLVNEINNDALRLAEKTGSAKTLAESKVAIGIKYLSNSILFKKQVRKGKNLLLEAEKYFEQNDKEGLNSVHFWLGKADLMLRKYDDSIENFRKVLDNDQDEKIMTQLEGSAHAFLIDAYIKNGEPDYADQHCQAIGKMRPWKEDSEPVPLYRTHPKYPKSARRRLAEGWVKVSFTVTDKGTVKDVNLVDNYGPKSFIKASKEAIVDWRFAPKFENGKAVDATALYTLQYRMSN